MAYSAQILDSVHKNDPMGFWSQGNLDAKKVADFINFKKPDVARIANVAPKSVRFDSRISKPVLAHMMQMANICSIVAELLNNDVEKTKLWLNTPNPAVGDISPKQLMRFGKYQKLLKFVLDAKTRSDG